MDDAGVNVDAAPPGGLVLGLAAVSVGGLGLGLFNNMVKEYQAR